MRQNCDGAQYVQWFGPVLDALRSLGGSGRPDEVVAKVAHLCKTPRKQQEELTESGAPRFPNQVAWARFYLSREGLIDSSQHGVWTLTDKARRRRLSSEEARRIFLKWVHFFQKRRRKKGATILVDVSHADQILHEIHRLSAKGFEQFCQRLLREAGFANVEITGRSGDGGIDGIGLLQINPLVSIKVLFQCKRFKISVGPSVVRDFRGAMQGRADKGIILTTGTFTGEARREALRDGVSPIELVAGDRLVRMCEELKLGLNPRKAFDVDQSFFVDFDSEKKR